MRSISLGALDEPPDGLSPARAKRQLGGSGGWWVCSTSLGALDDSLTTVVRAGTPCAAQMSQCSCRAHAGVCAATTGAPAGRPLPLRDPSRRRQFPDRRARGGAGRGRRDILRVRWTRRKSRRRARRGAGQPPEGSGRRVPRGARPPTPPDVLIVSGGFPQCRNAACLSVRHTNCRFLNQAGGMPSQAAGP